MKIYNTLTRKVEDFISKEPGVVKMYTCGPTVYHYAHIGNLRTYIFEDILEKTLNYIGYKVDRVMNITDVGHLQSDGDTGEDKMLKGAKREHKSVMDIAKYYTDCFKEDCNELNQLVMDGKIKPVLYETVSLEDLPIALQKMYDNTHQGNTAIRIGY